jgi:hypothetical protein
MRPPSLLEKYMGSCHCSCKSTGERTQPVEIVGSCAQSELPGVVYVRTGTKNRRFIDARYHDSTVLEAANAEIREVE